MVMAAIIAAACLTACSEKEDNPVEQEGSKTVEIPESVEPTTDQLTVGVTADMPVAVLSHFDENSVGAAFIRRLPSTTPNITDDTKLALFRIGERNFTDEEWRSLARLYNRGGYIAIEKPTTAAALVFVLTLGIESYLAFQEDLAQSVTVEGKDAIQARAGQTESPFVQQLQNRVSNAAAATRAQSIDDVMAEMFIIGPKCYFVQDPYGKQSISTSYTDMEDNESEPKETVTEAEYNQYRSGLMADAVAEWINSRTESEQQASARRHAMTRGGNDAINSLLSCSDEFTHNLNLPWVNASHYYFNNPDRVTERYLIWGVHNFKTNTDYYYVEQKTTLKMGGRNKKSNSCIYWGPEESDIWYIASNFVGDDGKVFTHYYGSWLKMYETSMNLTGNAGSQIQLEDALPYTDNTEGSKSIAIGTFESTNEVAGITWGASGGYNELAIDFGGYYEYGVTTGTNFTMTTTTTKKEFPVVKNTEGNKVTWTYEAPNHLEPHYYYDNKDRHSECPDILCNDANTNNSICWSVKNPVGSYTLDLTSTRKTRCLLMNEDYYTTWNAWNTKSYDHKLSEPNRAQQNWFMDISIDETEGQPHYNIKGTLIDNIRHSFPKTYTNEFSIADKTASSTDMIEAIVNAQCKVFDSQKTILVEHAKSLYIKKFTIRWTCDSPELKGVVYKYEVKAY